MVPKAVYVTIGGADSHDKFGIMTILSIKGYNKSMIKFTRWEQGRIYGFAPYKFYVHCTLHNLYHPGKDYIYIFDSMSQNPPFVQWPIKREVMSSF